MIALLACGILAACGAGVVHAGPRFGDSTWVAPAAMFDSAYTSDGPRVASPDQERAWETALRTPFRIVFFPLRLLGSGLEAAARYVGPRYLSGETKPPPEPGPKVAPFVGLGAVNDIRFGAALTWVAFPIFNSNLRLAGSWSTFDGRTASFSQTIGERRPVGFRLGVDYDYKPNRRYYGIGNNTVATNLSYFLLSSTRAEASLLFGATPLQQLRLGGGYLRMSPGSGYHGEPLLEDTFTPASVPYQDQTTQALWYGVAGALAALDNARDPSLGIQGLLDVRKATGLEATDPDYYQWRLEGRAYAPLLAKRRVIAVRAVYAGVEPAAGTTTLPFYTLPDSRGLSRFAGYATDRFRDRQLMIARVEYRWPLLSRVNVLALYEVGEVAPTAGAFTLRDAHQSYGGGMRVGLSDESALRFELATSVEGLHAFVGLGSDF